MRTTLINVKVEPKVKEEAQKIASALGLNLSSIIHAYLRDFIRTKEVRFQLQRTPSQKPSKRLVQNIRQSEREFASGDAYSFRTPREALAFLDHISNTNNGD